MLYPATQHEIKSLTKRQKIYDFQMVLQYYEIANAGWIQDLCLNFVGAGWIPEPTELQ